MTAAERRGTKMRWARRALLGVAALGAVAFAARDVILGRHVETRTAVRGDVVQSVVASGRVMTPRRVAVGTVLTERVERIPVQEGQRVRKGDLLIELDSRDERAAVEQAQASVAQAEARLRQIREVAMPSAEQARAQALANAEQARRQHERTRALREQGFVGQAQLDDARRNLEVAESQLRASRLQVESNSLSGSDYALARTALDQARASLAAARARLAQTAVHAPADGVLIGRGVEPGNIAQAGRDLMSLAPDGEIQIVVQMDERQLARLAVGQKALASADAFPEQRFAAELFYLNPGVDAQRGSVEVKLRVPSPPAYLRQDMTVSVDIEVARASDTVVVPADVVHEAAGAHPWVLALREGRAVRQPVKVGLHGEARIEILEGVQPGAMLVAAGASPVRPGERVRTGAVAGPLR